MATRIFTDLDLSFKAHPVTGDLALKFDEQAIKNSVRNLVLTRHRERPFHPDIGSSVFDMLFENPNPGTLVMIQTEITNVIENYEPRVNLLDVTALYTPDYNKVMITILFRIVNTVTPITLQFPLERTR